jgi:hypothetical protein
VTVDFARGSSGFSSHPATCHPGPVSTTYCWVATKTDGRGSYDFAFDAIQAPHYGVAGYVGSIAAFADGYDANMQMLPGGPTNIVQDLRLTKVQPIGPGQSTTVLVDSGSSLCSDREGLFALDSRCETVVVDVNDPGMLVVEARATDGGGAPTIYWYTSGNYSGGQQRTGPGAASAPVRPGSFRILVGTPAGSPSQRFNVTTSLQ